MVRVSPHFTLTELCNSRYKTITFPNIPDAGSLINLTHLCTHVLEPIRTLLGNRPLYITSGYRCKEINEQVNGSWNSQHLIGQAVDFVCDDPKNAVLLILSSKIPFDQMILYDKFIHISYNPFGENRFDYYDHFKKVL